MEDIYLFVTYTLLDIQYFLFRNLVFLSSSFHRRLFTVEISLYLMMYLKLCTITKQYFVDEKKETQIAGEMNLIIFMLAIRPIYDKGKFKVKCGMKYKFSCRITNFILKFVTQSSRIK